jgi:putative protease
MYGGRAGRDYITRTQPDNHGAVLGTVVGRQGGELIVEVVRPIVIGDGLGFEPADPPSARQSVGFAVARVRTLSEGAGVHRQAIETRVGVPAGWRVVRSSSVELLRRARESYASLPAELRVRRTRLDARVFGAHGTPLKAVFTADGESVTVRSELSLSPAQKRSLSRDVLREQLGRLGETPFALAALDDAGLAPGLFLPLSELNHVRQQAVDELLLRRDWAEQARLAAREAQVEEAVAGVADAAPVAGATDLAVGQRQARGVGAPPQLHDRPAAARARNPSIALVVDPPPAAELPFRHAADVHRLEDAYAAAASGATEIAFDPCLRHPLPPVSRIRALAGELAEQGVAFRLRTPTILRPDDRRLVRRWLELDVPVLSGHLGLVAELAAAGRDVTADYAVNCFNQHTAAGLFRLGARRIVLSVELTADEMRDTAAPWNGRGFEVVAFGRPEGMTIELCVLSAAFDREPPSCRDLCVQKHALVELTDPAGYTVPVATDFACRNRLLHSRPVDGSEYVPRLWHAGLRDLRLLFNLPGDDVSGITAAYRAMLGELAAGERADTERVRALLGGAFTRGHFARAV